MSNKCSTLRSLTNLSQVVDNFLSTSNNLTSTDINNLINQVLSVQGAVRSLPINPVRKNDILSRLDQAVFILQGNAGLNNIAIILAVSQIIQTVRLKIEDLCLPCPQGIVTVHPSNVFNTACCDCC